MKISIFGLGYVGCVGVGCLAKMGHEVVGVDNNKYKVDLINKGIPTIVEKEIDLLIGDGFKNNCIRATTDYFDAVLSTDISFICVPTPNKTTGHLDLQFVEKVSEEIAKGIKAKKTGFHVVIIRSTVLPGTNKVIKTIIQNVSGKKDGIDFCVVSNPEFLREGNAVSDFFNPSVTVIGSTSEKGVNILKELYSVLPGTIKVVKTEVAETIKLLNNSFHSLKVAFANEVGSVCKAVGIDTFELIDLFLADDKLNISPSYLKPGFAYGGSCLPKDLRALNLLAHDSYLSSPILGNIEKSNQDQIERAIKIIESKSVSKILFYGISFKDGTDDLRNSAIVEVVQRLLGKGYKIEIFDKNINLSLLTGANKLYIEEKLPHFSGLLLNDLEKALDNSELVVINTKITLNEIDSIHQLPGIKILDLRYIPELVTHPNYEGINW